MKWTTEAKVGLFTLIGIIAFTLCIVFLGKMDVFTSPKMQVIADFKTAGGIKEGSAVKLSGVNIGHVKDLSLSHDGVVITMKVDKSVEIPEDSEFVLESDGILGDKFIAIRPGMSKVYLHDGSRVKGDGNSEMDKTMRQATQLMASANKTLESINGIIGDQETQKALSNTLKTTEVIAQNTAALTGQMNAMLAHNSDNVSALASNMVGITKNMESLTSQMDSQMKQFNKDGQVGDEMRQIVNNLRETTDSITKMATAMESIVTDPTSVQDVKTTLHNTAQLTTKLNRLTGGDVQRKKAENGEKAEKKSDLKADIGAEVLYNRDNKSVSGNASFRLFMGKGLAEIGVSNLGNGTNLEATYGKYLYKNVLLRGGLYDGEIGLGLDYGLGTKWSLSAAVYDIHSSRYRFRSELKIFDDTYAVAQLLYPLDERHGGRYFGIRRSF